VREFAEIRHDIGKASGVNDASSLRALAEEIRGHATKEAEAISEQALGQADQITGQLQSALSHFQSALSAFTDLGDTTSAIRVTHSMGNIYRHLHDYEKATILYERALAGYQDAGDQSGVARVTGSIGMVYESTGDNVRALEYLERSLAMHVELGNAAHQAITISNIGNVYDGTGDYPKALEYFRRALMTFETLGDLASIASITNNLGRVLHKAGDFPHALEQSHRALAIYEQIGNRLGAAKVIGNIGNIYLMTGDPIQALDLYHQCVERFEDLGNIAGVARMNGNIGNVYVSMGEHEKALDFFVRARRTHEELGDRAEAAHVIGHIIMILFALDRYDEAAGLLNEQASMIFDDPRVKAEHYRHYATLFEHQGDLDAARDHLIRALDEVTSAGARSEMADYHLFLRELAVKRDDFKGYIKHNLAYIEITNELHGQEATRKLAMIEADKLIQAERAEKEQHRVLLYNTLPPSIADRMLRGEHVNDTYDQAAVLFMDLVGFTKISGTLKPDDLVAFMNEVFTVCDSIIVRHSLTKIKTIGDAYMAVAFPQESSSSEQRVASIEERSANAALDMLHAVSHIVSPAGSPIQVRIGLHCGPLTAGIIGTERIQYDVWGDTVNVASRMESTGEPGRIHVSEAFADALKTSPPGRVTETSTPALLSSVREGTSSPFPVPSSLIPRGEMEIKGKGLMTTYWLERA
jgi:class 3 adenylate cyclase